MPQQNYSVINNVITFHCSDGSRKIRPDPEENVITPTFIDYMEECTKDHAALKLWKQKIGSFLARYVLKRQDAAYRQYILASLPAGYALYVHKKGEPGDLRTDVYLWGSKTAPPFRSPAEFFFHAKWILEGCPKPDSPLQHDEQLWGEPLPEDFVDRCGCTYCAKTSQKYISRTYSNYTPAKKVKTKAKFR